MDFGGVIIFCSLLAGWIGFCWSIFVFGFLEFEDYEEHYHKDQIMIMVFAVVPAVVGPVSLIWNFCICACGHRTKWILGLLFVVSTLVSCIIGCISLSNLKSARHYDGYFEILAYANYYAADIMLIMVVGCGGPFFVN